MELKRISLGLMLIVTAVVSACSGESEPPASRFEVAKGGDDRNGPYDIIPGWWKPAPDHDETWTWGSAAGVWCPPPGVSVSMAACAVVLRIKINICCRCTIRPSFIPAMQKAHK